MSFTILAAFVVTCFILAITPGPNMALIIANTLRGGLHAGLATLAGTTTGLGILVTIASLGMSSIMSLMANWFDVVRWCGALYLAFLGARQLWAAWRSPPTAMPQPPGPSASLYMQGMLVSLSNPKTLLFLGAFLPQFVDPSAPALSQLVLLAVLFVAILAVVDLVYTVGIARARTSLDPRRFRMLDGISGVLLLAGGLVLASTRRS